MINEIIILPSNTIIIINKRKRKLKFLYIDYNENTVPLESSQGLKIIDKWVDKWGYIFRSLNKKTNNLAFDLSGGFDTRSVFSILISSGINLNNIFIKTYEYQNKNPSRSEDLNIAKNISDKYKFRLNNFSFDNKSIKWSINDSLFCTIYSKLGFHKEFYLKDKFYKKPKIVVTGFGGENIRGYPGYPIGKYLESISSQGNKIISDDKLFYNSSMKLCNRSIDILKKRKKYKSDYEISSDLYLKGRTRSHFGTSIV